MQAARSMVCSVCTAPINVGDPITWDRANLNGRIYHVACKPAPAEPHFIDASHKRINTVLHHLNVAYTDLDILRKTAPNAFTPALEHALAGVGKELRRLTTIRDQFHTKTK